MPQMTDPANALALFQQAFERWQIPVQPGRLDRELLFAPDTPNGHPRFNYMRAEGRTLTALVMFAQSGMEQGHPVFNIGYAVPEAYRSQGLARSTLVGSLAELSAGLGSTGIPFMHVEAVIDVDHLVSQRVAQAIFDDAPAAITDSESGLPALHYIRKIELKRP
jgi:hypothetical protein